MFFLFFFFSFLFSSPPPSPPPPPAMLGAEGPSAAVSRGSGTSGGLIVVEDACSLMYKGERGECQEFCFCPFHAFSCSIFTSCTISFINLCLFLLLSIFPSISTFVFSFFCVVSTFFWFCFHISLKRRFGALPFSSGKSWHS